MNKNEIDKNNEEKKDGYINNTEKLLAILCYVGPLFLIALLYKGNEKLKFHAMQGIVLFVFLIICGGICFILNFIPILGAVASSLIAVFDIYLMCTGISNASSGKDILLPFIGKYGLK